ncbi:MAG TPA: hypothetical protein VN733_03625, partial [Solirubrobacterales bacterium]|nr:hypothetical protein [Solirubrobacterales bacterium]
MRARCMAIALSALATGLLFAPAAGAAPAKPAWQLDVTAMPTSFAPGAVGTTGGGPAYLVLLTNVGAAPSSGAVTIADTLPTGLKPTETVGPCPAPVGQTVTCTIPGAIAPGESIEARIVVEVQPLAPPSVTNQVTAEGGGADQAESQTLTNAVSATPPPFGILPGFEMPLSEADGGPATLAGSHPYQLTTRVGFPTEKGIEALGGAGHLRDIGFELPPGLVVNPAATPVLCTEAELSSDPTPGCPSDSQVGVVDLITTSGGPIAYASPLYNMVPPPGTAAELGFDALGVGVFVHLDGSVRSDGDYGITGTSRDALALTLHPVFGAQAQLWGEPWGASHDSQRLPIVGAPETAAITMPVHCSGEPTSFLAKADSWEKPGVFEQASYESASLADEPAVLEGCDELDFEPTIEAKPTTNLTDSPSGLDFRLHHEQPTDIQTRAPAIPREIGLTLPPGLVVNPAAGVGQEACDSAQIGLSTPIGASPIHFS